MFKRYKTNKTENRTDIPDEFIRDKNLSLKAKGLMLYIMSLPDWNDFTPTNLAKTINEPIETVFSALHELEKRGFFHMFCMRNKGEESEEIYEFYENPNEWWKGVVDESEKVINDFIELYLDPKKEWNAETSFEEKGDKIFEGFMLHDENTRGWILNAIANHIKKMNYQDFLKTRYWKFVSEWTKEKAGNKCSICNSTDRLEVHHKTYEHHGNELEHPEDLICLCHNCHTKIHDK